MKYRSAVLWVGMFSLVLASSLFPSSRASASGTPQLVISQIKLTSSAGQFVTLFNQTAAAIDLSQYEVDYISSTGKLTSVPISGQLPAHGYYMLDDDQVRLCYQMALNAVSLGFSTTGGSLQIWQLSTDKTTKQLQDSITWASKATTGAVTLPAQNSANTVSLLRQPTDAQGNLQLASPAAGSWQAVAPDTTNPCSLDIINTTTTLPSGSSSPSNKLGVGQAPLATIITLAAETDSTTGLPSLPDADVGLAAPQITELLPNPDGTGTDATDEFIELYNPNPVAFHLVGFVLQTGSATKHSYTFPDGTLLEPESFTAFYSADTGLSLSNTAGQADLLDPLGNNISQTDPYGTAKDGQTWALANGAWFWTSRATPNGPNVITQAATTPKKSSSQSSKSTSGAKVTASKTGGQTSASSASGQSGSGAAAAVSPAPVRPLVLAGVAALAVAYGVYEYRHDLANKLRGRRSNLPAGRSPGLQAAGR